MTYAAQGEITSTLPAPGSTSVYGLVLEIIFAPNLAATGIVTLKQGTSVIKQFNPKGATGSTEPDFRIRGPVDPTVFSVTPDGISRGLWVTYVIE